MARPCSPVESCNGAPSGHRRKNGCALSRDVVSELSDSLAAYMSAWWSFVLVGVGACGRCFTAIDAEPDTVDVARSLRSLRDGTRPAKSLEATRLLAHSEPRHGARVPLQERSASSAGRRRWKHHHLRPRARRPRMRAAQADAGARMPPVEGAISRFPARHSRDSRQQGRPALQRADETRRTTRVPTMRGPRSKHPTGPTRRESVFEIVIDGLAGLEARPAR